MTKHIRISTWCYMVITFIMYDNTHPEKELNQNVFKHMPEHVIVCSLSIAIILFSSLGG